MQNTLGCQIDECTRLFGTKETWRKKQIQRQTRVFKENPPYSFIWPYSFNWHLRVLWIQGCWKVWKFGGRVVLGRHNLPLLVEIGNNRSALPQSNKLWDPWNSGELRNIMSTSLNYSLWFFNALAKMTRKNVNFPAICSWMAASNKNKSLSFPPCRSLYKEVHSSYLPKNK